MSVILDALRKLDREKSSRRKGTANIAVEILSPDLTRPGKRIPVYIVTVAVAAIAAAAITYGVMSEFGFLSKPSPPATKTIPAPSQQPAPASPKSGAPSKLSLPAPVNPPAASKQIPASVLRVPVRDTQEELSKVPPKVQSPAETKPPVETKTPVEIKAPTEPKPLTKPLAETKPPVTSLGEKKTVIPEKVEPDPGSTRKTVETTPGASSSTPASLKLSAIVWYEDPSKRFAMINGIMATEGSSVEGMKVVEINPTSVRLLHDGQYFEISMSK